MNKYFEAFKNEISWFNYKNESIEVFEIEEFNLTNRFKEIFPITTKLINSSKKTGVEFKGKSLILFTWEIENEISGWLSQFDKPEIELIEEHQILIDNIGGIVESFKGPESIDLNGINYNYSLTLNQDFMFVGSLNTNKLDWADSYIEKCKKLNLEPIDLSDKVYLTREANGARYFYDTSTKEVKLFSQDHNFKFVESLPNQPELTMHKIRGVNTFNDFVELISGQWNKHFEIKKKITGNKE